MKFFDSEVVQAEMAEISDLQEEIYRNVFTFPTMEKEDKIKHIDLLQRLLDKQKILYTRISLSDDPDAQRMKNRIAESATMMGLPDNMDINSLFNNMSKVIQAMREGLDKL
jgi:hypothetical protein